MPISLDPNGYVWTWLERDKDIPHDKRPAFKTRAFSMRDEDEWREKYDALLLRTDLKRGEVVDLLLTRVTDWRHFPEPLSADTVMKYLSAVELWEMVRELHYKCSIGEQELKKFDLPLQSGGAASAPAATADATTNPPS